MSKTRKKGKIFTDEVKPISTKMRLVLYFKDGKKSEEKNILSYQEINGALLYRELCLFDGQPPETLSFVIDSSKLDGYKIIKKNSVFVKRLNNNFTLIGGLLGED